MAHSLVVNAPGHSEAPAGGGDAEVGAQALLLARVRLDAVPAVLKTNFKLQSLEGLRKKSPIANLRDIGILPDTNMK